MPDWSRGRGQTKNSPWSSRLGLGGGPITHPLKTKQITETLNTRRQSSLGANVVPCLSKQSMTPLSQSREEAQELNKPLMTPRVQIRIGNWNVRTMYTTEKSAQVARVMNQVKIQIMGISECRWTRAGRMKLSSGETVLYSGRDDDQHMQGVAIMMTQEATKALIDWSPINERIIKARFYSKFVKLTVIHVYAPTNDADEQTKDDFYGKLQEVAEQVHKHDMLIITGDMNAKEGNVVNGLERVMGRHGLGTVNDNGERLKEFCDFNEMVITGTVFPHKEIHKQTWVSPDGRTKNQIDHTLVDRRFRTSVLATRSIRSADVGSDHYLVRSPSGKSSKEHR